MRRWFALALVAAACSPARPRAPHAATGEMSDEDALRDRATKAGTKDPAGWAVGERLALFDDLVDEVHAAHRFSPNTWENLSPITFEAAIPELRRAFEVAATEAELNVALVRFGNSLHDAHGGFVPAPPPPAHINLPLVLAPEGEGNQVSMVVTASRANGIDLGDVITSYAGTPADDLLRAYANRSNANQWRGIALGIAKWMTERPADGGDGVEGETVTLGLRKQDGTETFTNVTWSRGGWHGDDVTEPDAPVYDHERCAAGLPVRKYPSYEIASHGGAYCLYVSKSAKYAPFPVLRFFSFNFGKPFDAEAEHEHLALSLRGLVGVRGLILDLRDNGGGNDPKWALEWFAPSSYLDLETRIRKTPAFDTLVLEDVANLDQGWVNAL